MAKTRWLSRREERAWRTYRQMQMLLSAQIAAEAVNLCEAPSRGIY